MLPPLRDRLDDIHILAEHFAKQIAAQNGWKVRAFSAAAIEELKRYAWPGNVRELRNVIERLLLLATGDEITAEDVVAALPQLASPGITGESGAAATGTLANRVEAYEREVLLAELKRHNHHMTNVAKALGLERSHLYKKCQQLGIDVRDLRKPD